MKNEIKELVRGFIINTFMQKQGQLKDDDSLFVENVIDSFGLLELISFIEKKFSVAISPSEVMAENFESVNKITQLIEKKHKISKSILKR